MALVTLKPGAPPVDVEFPDGALHLYPGTYRAVTDEQLEALRKDPALADKIVVLNTAKPSASPAPPAPAPSAVIIPDPPATAEEPPAPAPEDPTPQDKKRHKRHG